MRKAYLVACAGLLASTAAFGQSTVYVDESGPQWLGFMNVSELPSNGGAYVFGSSWGVPDLRVEFDDANSKMTFLPNSINDPNEFWYQNTSGMAPDPVNPGGPGQAGNKYMEANLYQEATDVYNGQTLTFEGEILSNSFTQAHEAFIFVRDFAPDYSSSVDVFVPVTAGPFSLSLATDAGAGRHVQWGFQVKGENVWITDIAPFGNMMVATVPAPASLAAVGFAGAFASRRRR